LEGAFALRRGAPVEGLTVALVDDVLTTGSTADACARVLREAGAAAVVVITVARG
jgi:predicted amidophosphoribosyltransferase